MHLPETIIDCLEAEVGRCRTVVDVEAVLGNVLARFPDAQIDRDEAIEILVDRASARGLAVKFDK